MFKSFCGSIIVISFVFLASCEVSRKDGLSVEYTFNGNLNDYVSAEIAKPFGEISFERTPNTKGLRLLKQNEERSSFIKLPNTEINSAEYTISFFVKFDNLKKTNSLLFFGDEEESWGNSGLYIYIEGNKIAVCQQGQILTRQGYSFKEPLNTTFTDSKNIEENKFYLITLTYFESLVEVYLNGVSVALYENVKPLLTKERDLLIGVARDPKQKKYKFQLNGVIDELRIYEKKLSSEQVVSLFDKYSPRK